MNWCRSKLHLCSQKQRVCFAVWDILQYFYDLQWFFWNIWWNCSFLKILTLKWLWKNVKFIRKILRVFFKKSYPKLPFSIAKSIADFPSELLWFTEIPFSISSLTISKWPTKWQISFNFEMIVEIRSKVPFSTEQRGSISVFLYYSSNVWFKLGFDTPSNFYLASPPNKKSIEFQCISNKHLPFLALKWSADMPWSILWVTLAPFWIKSSTISIWPAKITSLLI